MAKAEGEKMQTTKNKIQTKTKSKIQQQVFRIVLSKNNLRDMIELIQETSKSYDGHKTFIFTLNHDPRLDRDLVHLDYQVLIRQLNEVRKKYQSE